jgi:hypothetical protein
MLALHPSTLATGHPRAGYLSDLVAKRVDGTTVLKRLAALHRASAHAEVAFRLGFVNAGGRSFPHPADLTPLCWQLFARLLLLWDRCQNPFDDLLVVAFGVYGVLAIHPFDNANGRVAIDFAQLLLMHRWGSAQPPLALPDDAHRILAPLMQALDPPCDGESIEAFVALRGALSARFSHMTLEQLAAHPSFRATAEWFETGVRE